jgi:ABC-type polysaccharide/polyol phosphate transport system ATPase subunit
MDSEEEGMATERVILANISKRYRLYSKPTDRLREWATLGKRCCHRDFWALRDLTLSVEEGEALGIIGENGAGKTTLLKIISGTAFATEGEVQVQGRLTALLELGTGFHPEFTGRENIMLNARLVGLSQEEIRRRMPEVIEFAELREFIDQPVRTYSSGMQVRLGFAVASSVNPDVLAVDEALAVGDAYFQKKSLDRVRHYLDGGMTFLFVTHDLSLVRRFCSRCIWLKEGRIEAMGETHKVVSAYEDYSREKQLRRLGLAQDERAPAPLAPAPRSGSEFRPPGSRWGNGRIRITKVDLLGEDGTPRWVFQMGERVTLRLEYESRERLKNPVFSFQVNRLDGIYVMGTSNAGNNIDEFRLGPISGSGSVEYEIESLSLHRGTYFLSVQAFPEPDEPFWSDPGDFHYQRYEFKVWSPYRQHGVVALPGRWKKAGVKVT